jgi:hypothetical protein
MVRATIRFLTSGLGFLLATALGAWGVVLGIDSATVERAAESARWLAASSPIIAGLHIFIVRQLYELRDCDELKRCERETLRAIIQRRTSAIWLWVVVATVLAALSVAAPILLPTFGSGVVYLTWMGTFWVLYSLLLIPVWSGEIASFRSLIADRKRERGARSAALKVLTDDAEKGWQKIEALDAYVKPPE